MHPLKLTEPDSTAQKHSQQLTQHIQQIISAAGGQIDFARFMELALYAPGLGYYSSGTHKLGRQGDFITAPEISPLFARCIARQCKEILTELKQANILEFGAGTGALAKDLLLELEKLNCLPDQYFILEISAELRERQLQLLQSTCPHLIDRIIWLDHLPNEFSGIILANEVLDAFPTHCFRIEKDGIKERFVTWNQDHFAWRNSPAQDEVLKKLEKIVSLYNLNEGYESEINLIQPAWINSIATILKQGVVLLFDYGYGQAEYYHSDRSQGTLQCYYQHTRHSDPLIYVGLQDMTAHVDFTAVAEAACDAGLEIAGFTTQASFLLACGLLELAQQNHLSAAEQYQQAHAIKQLTLPSQMGEAIKVIGFSKNIKINLMGFSLMKRDRLL